ncbi:MAG: PadR family transcriptional regulator [Bifidobacteriaceae bacterium]|jgi:DNA-binding PadR family transcriptional regulator|nr:PadR family transcriptional regulator [Bifidobacteriaceae bacterium]
MRSRSSVLELAILGLLHTAPMHGYELRKRLNALLGPLRAFSYGTLYPCLRGLSTKGLIASSSDDDARALGGKRARIVYGLTDAGTMALEAMLGEAGPASWEDESFDVRFAFFAQTDVDTRLRVLEGRRLRMAERLDALRAAGATGATPDPYAAELHRHGMDQLRRELDWLDGLIETERASRPRRSHRTAAP